MLQVAVVLHSLGVREVGGGGGLTEREGVCSVCIRHAFDLLCVGKKYLLNIFVGKLINKWIGRYDGAVTSMRNFAFGGEKVQAELVI